MYVWLLGVYKLLEGQQLALFVHPVSVTVAVGTQSVSVKDRHQESG